MRPRIQVCAGGVARLLEEEVAELLAKGERSEVWLVGTHGSGMTTALAHLAAVFAGDSRLRLRDHLGPATAADFLVEVVASPSNVPARAELRPAHVWRMAPWSDDDCLEYLRSVHGDRTARAWSAWRASNAEHDLRQWPGVCTAVLDLLATGDDAADPLQALRALLREAIAGIEEGVRSRALRDFLREHAPGHTAAAGSTRTEELLRSRSARALLAAERLVHLAGDPGGFALRSLQWERALAIAVIVILQQEPATAERLVALVRGEGRYWLALSLLCIARPGFRPERERLDDLAHALLAYADLQGRTLAGDCTRVHLPGCNLRGASFLDCSLDRAVLSGADLTRATWRGVRGRGLRASNLVADGLLAEGAALPFAELAGARLWGAKLAGAILSDAGLAGADCTGADFSGADLSRTDLRTVVLRGTKLIATRLHRVVACDVVWPGLAASEADWSHADLTGSNLQKAQLQRATFTGCGLAHVDWQGADLRHADLRGATFHFGSSRSGLVGSTIAGEGSRTGFYTDESLEDHFQSPEQVRKANLQDCDLRGADLTDVDLYLVDLRGARLDPEQRQWARACRALLGERETG